MILSFCDYFLVDGDGGQPSQEMSPMNGNAMNAQLNNIRLKLEEKRRRIEHEKKRMEMSFNRQRQQVGQQAFLQAVTKVIILQLILVPPL